MIRLFQSDTKTLQFQLVDESDNPIDITGDNIIIAIDGTRYSCTITDAVNGEFEFQFNPANTTDEATLRVYELVWQYDPTNNLEYTLTSDRILVQRIVNPFSPLNITGLLGWYKADSLLLSDGQAVGNWTDVSGNGNDIVQATGSKQPIYKIDQINGQPIVRFDGIDDELSIGTLGTITQGIEIFVVAKINTMAANERIVNIQATLTDGVQLKGASATELRIQSGAIPSTSTYVFNSAYALYNVNYDLPTFNTILNVNSVQKINETLDSIANLNGEFTVAADQASANFFDGDIAEVIVYDRRLTYNERLQVQSYIQQKYNLY